jgi:hypothetical protein
MARPPAWSDAAGDALVGGLKQGLADLKEEFEDEIKVSTPASGRGGGEGVFGLGFAVTGQATLTLMEDGDEAHIASALGRMVGEISRVQEEDLPRRGGTRAIDWDAVVRRSSTVAVDTERISDLKDEVLGSDGNKKKARPSNKMKQASAASVASTVMSASAIIGAAGAVGTIGGIAYGDFVAEGVIGDEATITDDAGYPLPTAAIASPPLQQYVSDITGVEYSPGLKAAHPWIVGAVVPGDESVCAMPEGGVLVLYGLPGNHFTWPEHLVIHGPGKGGIGLGVEALASVCGTQQWQLASAIGALTQGFEVRAMKDSPLYKDYKPISLSELGES